MFLRSWFLPAAIVARDIQLIYICLSKHFYRIFIFIKFAECFFFRPIGSKFLRTLIPWKYWGGRSNKKNRASKNFDSTKILETQHWKQEKWHLSIHLFIYLYIYLSNYLLKTSCSGDVFKNGKCLISQIHLLIYLSIYLSIDLSDYLSKHETTIYLLRNQINYINMQQSYLLSQHQNYWK